MRGVIYSAALLLLVAASFWRADQISGLHHPTTARADTGPGLEGPYVNSATSASTSDVRSLPPSNGSSRPSKSFLHARGNSRLDDEKSQVVALPAGAGLTSSGVSGPSVASAPGTGVGFDGIGYNDTSCGCYPPDGAVAAGPNNLIAAVNTAFKIWDKSGNLLKGATELGSLFSVNSNCYRNVSDPFADYDAAAGRFVLGALTYNRSYASSMCIAVSTSGNPLGSWYVYGFPVQLSGGLLGTDLLDFPHIAIGSDAIYLSGNQFQSGKSYVGTRLYAYNKAQMYAGASASAVYYNITDTSKDTLSPARQVGVAKTMYFLATANCNGCSTVWVWKWTDPFGASSLIFRGGATVATYYEPPNAVQPGTGQITTNDTADLGTAWFTNTLYGVHTIGCNPGNGTVACVQWYQIGNLDGPGSPAALQQGTLAGNGQYRFFPNVAIDGLGNAAVGFAYSSATEYAGVRVTGPASGTEIALKAGQATVNGGRYGDYAGTVLDPDGCTVWHFEEYAKAGTLWGTWLGSVSFVGCLSPAPTPTATPAASATPTPTPTPTASPSPSPTPTVTPTPTPTATPTLSPTPIPTVTPTSTPSATPSAPQTLTAWTASGRGVSLAWAPPSSTGSGPLIQYNIYRGDASGSETFLIATSNTSYKDAATVRGQTYYYDVTAVNVAGEGPASNEASAAAK